MQKKITISSKDLLKHSLDEIKSALLKKINKLNKTKSMPSDKKIDKELDLFEKKLEIELLNSTRELANSTYEYIKRMAFKELKYTRDLYLKNLNIPQQISKGLYVITLNEKANFIENGEGFDMKPGLLKNAKHSSKTGYDYKIIPFKHNRNSPSASDRAREISRKIRNEMKKKKILIEKLEMQRSSERNKKIPKLGKVARLDFIEKETKRNAKTLHKINVYQNLINKSKNLSIRNVKRDIFTFRTVTNSPDQKNKWLYPNKEGRNFFEKAEKFVIKEWENKILPRLLKKLE